MVPPSLQQLGETHLIGSFCMQLVAFACSWAASKDPCFYFLFFLFRLFFFIYRFSHKLWLDPVPRPAGKSHQANQDCHLLYSTFICQYWTYNIIYDAFELSVPASCRFFLLHHGDDLSILESCPLHQMSPCSRRRRRQFYYYFFILVERKRQFMFIKRTKNDKCFCPCGPIGHTFQNPNISRKYLV